MRIGIDARTCAGETGVAQYGKHLIAAMRPVAADDELIVFEKEPNPAPVWSAHVEFRRTLKKAKLNLLHFLGGTPPYGYRKPYVLTVHDLAIYLHPEWFPDGQWFSTKISFPSSIKLARHIIVPSGATKNDLLRLFKVREEKISVIPHGVSLPVPAPPADAKRYILHLGTIEPRKNLRALIHAYRRLIDHEPELRDVALVLAGPMGWKTEETIDEIRKTQCEGYKIELLGQVSEDKKTALLAGAACLALPTLYEGFGLPVLEAMGSGVPVVCSNIAALPEVSGNAALLVGPHDIDGWTAGLSSVLKNKKFAAELRVKGLSRAQEFSWERTARLTFDVYRKITGAQS